MRNIMKHYKATQEQAPHSWKVDRRALAEVLAGLLTDEYSRTPKKPCGQE